MKRTRVVWALFLALTLLAGAAAQAQEPADLATRVGELEKQVDELKPAKGKGIKIGEFTFIPFGYIKVDAAYDDSRSFNGDFISWVLAEDPNATARNSATQAVTAALPDRNQFSLTANQTRFDLKIVAPKYENWESWGLFEFDLYGHLANRIGTSLTAAGGPDNRPAILIRHAFINLANGPWELLLGQTHDIISQQVPDTVNYFVCWMAGNPGYRRPQIRLTRNVPLTENSKFFIQAGVTRTIEDIGWIQAGEETGYPTSAARIGYTRPMFGKEFLIAVSGHYGREKVRNTQDVGIPIDIVGGITPTTAGIPASQNAATALVEDEVTSWSGNVELIVPLPMALSLKGEVYTGKTMGNYFGGIGQSVALVDGDIKGIRVIGGWAQLGWQAMPNLRFNLGGSIDEVKNEDIVTGMRSRNRSVWGNVWWDMLPKVTLGYEIGHWQTDYKLWEEGTNLRHQATAMFKF